MVDSPVAAPERDVLLATKLHLPGPRPDLVPRPRLTARLDEGLARGLVLACAPAGYGKTILLADWARRGGRPAGWLSLDAGDNDPARFWRHAVAALDRARPGISDRVAPLLGPPAPASFQGLVTALINELAAQPGDDEALLVLDDYHVIGSPQVHESLAFLVEHRPAGIGVVLASRSDPPLPLARARARGQLTEVREAELRFTPAEAAELLQHMASGLPDASVAALAARTEGWAAGLCSWPRCHCAGTTTLPRSWPRSPAATATCWTTWPRRCSTGRMSSCAHSCWTPRCWSGSAARCATPSPAARAARRCWSRPNGRACSWFRWMRCAAGGAITTCSPTCSAPACNNSSPDARRSCTATPRPGTPSTGWPKTPSATRPPPARRPGRPGSSSSTTTWFYNIRGEAATIHRWLSVLPDGVVRSRPRLLLAQAHMAADSGHLHVVEPLLDAVECAPPGWADEPFEPTAGVAASFLINVPALTTLHRGYLAQFRGDAGATAAFAAQALAESKPEERLLSATAHGFLAVAEWLRGRLTEAERALASSVTGWREAGHLTTTAWRWYELVLIRRAQGRLDAAVLTCEQALDSLVTSGRPLPAAGPGYAGLAEIACQRDELDVARRHATEAIALCRQFVYTPPLAGGLATLAMIRQATGDPAGALEVITEAGQAAPGPAGLLNPVPAQRARLLLAQGNLAAAARFPPENGLGPDDEPDYARESGHLALARILLAQDRPGHALALPDRLHAAAAAQDRTGSLIETGALRALALAATGDEAGALTALAGALMLARPQGYVRVFADEGPPMAALLGRLIAAQRTGDAAAGVPLGYLARLQRAFGAGQLAPDAVPAGIIDPLTSRELEVLAMLAAGRSNQAIAGELVVSLDTVKKHVGHVLAKLGAANRTEAVARARELSLIP